MISHFCRYDILAILLFGAGVAILCTDFVHVFPRLWESMRDFGLAVGEMGADMINTTFGTHLSVPSTSLAELSSSVRSIDFPLLSFDTIRVFGALFIDKAVFSAYLASLGPKLRNIAYILLIAMPFVVVGFYLFNRQFTVTKLDQRRSIPLRIVDDRLVPYFIRPVKEYIVGFIGFVKFNKVYKVLYGIELLLFFNVLAVGFEAFGWYFHLIATFSFKGFGMSIYKLFLDVLPGVFYVPFVIWMVVGVVVFDCLRKRRGYRVLEHNEAKDKGFIASLPIVNFVWGTMGSKKTTLLTDMALSYSAYFRFKAYQLLLDCDLLFPDFPWLSFERDLRAAMALERGVEGRVYNLYSAGKWVKSLVDRVNAGEHDLYGNIGVSEVSDGLLINDLADVLSDYAKLYLIYVVHSSLLISNYGIREDAVLSDLGNFPMWSFDFFKKDPAYSAACSRHSHILDFDTLKLGKKLVQGNVDSDGFEFGVVVITEIGKERGNQFDLRRLDSKSNAPSQLNDQFNDLLKLSRHFATVRFFPFIVFLVDDQRPDSWSADARDLCQLICVNSCDDRRSAMPFHFLDDFFHDLLYSRFTFRYSSFRYHRADNTLFMTAYKRFIAFVHRRYSVNHNTFDYMPIVLDLELGTRDGQTVRHPYYLSVKKIYADRFATDAFAGFVEAKVSRATYGLDDIEAFATTHATIDEMLSTNSYLIRNVSRIFINRHSE